MADPTRNDLPPLLYGTAWKEDATAELVATALRAGFRGIDTANQPRHYREDLVGAGLVRARDAGIPRESLFLQSKFTFARSHDHRVPYDATANYATQVQTSFSGTLEHLHTDYLDAFLLHGPLTRQGIVDGDLEVWSALEGLHRAGRTRNIGVCNVSIDQLVALRAAAQIGPHIVQNRCYAKYGWDEEVRDYCAEHGIVYQGFSVLTANRHVTLAPEVLAIAERVHATPAQVVFHFARRIGIVPLTGTKDTAHMLDGLRSGELSLSFDDLATIAALDAPD